MSSSDITFEKLFSGVMEESKFTDSLQSDFRGDLSFEDLINSAVSRVQRWSKLEHYVKSIEKTVRRKDDGIAKALREEGNSYYMKSDHKMALVKYNESIKFSPHPSMENLSDRKQSISYQNLSFSYGNRSALFFAMGLYDEACTDIRRAVSLGNCQQKLYVRYCKSFIYIHSKKKPPSLITSSVFDSAFKKTEAVLDFTLDDEQKKQISAHKFDVKKADINKIGIPKYSEVQKPVLDGEHPHILGLSNKVEFAARVKRGRYLIAGEDIYPGTLLAIDQGFITPTLLPKYLGIYCSSCRKPCTLIFVPCHQCTSAVFCNELCRDEAFKSYHRHECSVLPLFDTLELEINSYLTLRIIASLGYSKLHDYVKIFEKEEEAKKPSMAKRGFSSEGVYDSKSYRTVYYLSNHKELRDSKDLLEKSVMSVVMTFILKKGTTFFGEENWSSQQSVNNVHFNEREMLIAKLILRHLMSMPVNATSNTSSEVSSGSWNIKTIGGNIQCLISLFGHSCNPNAINVDSYTLRPLSIIPKGTEICICYTFNYALASKQQRQANLIRPYYFKCDCIACVEDWQVSDEINIDEEASNLRVKCMFGCKNGILNIRTPRCTKCSKGLKRDKSLYSETYLKHINKIIYDSSSENSNSIKRDMALTTVDFFTELATLTKSVLLFDWTGMLPNSLKLIREVTYNACKGIYLFDAYGDCQNNYILSSMRESLQRFHCFSSNHVTFQ